jgi:hypothetical protein
LRILMLAALLHGLAYLVLLPPWMGEDEPWHVEYAHHIASGHGAWGGHEMQFGDRELMTLSQLQIRRKIGGLDGPEIQRTQAELLDSMREHNFWSRVDWASWPAGAEQLDQVVETHTAAHQPPLYYLLGGGLLRLLRVGDVESQMWVLRGLGLLAYLAVVAATYALAWRVCSDPWIAVACALFAAWWPMHARQAGIANNDVLVKVFTAWILLLSVDMARGGITPRSLALALGLCVCALATKTTAAAALVPLGMALSWRGGRHTRALQPGRRALLIGSLLALAAAGLAFWFLTDNPAIPRSLDNIHARLATATSPAFRAELMRTFLGTFNWYVRDLPAAVRSTASGLLLLAGLGSVLVFLRAREGIERRALFFCLVMVLAQMALIGLRGVAAGRYLMPALPALSVLLVIGLLGPLPVRWRPRAVGLLVMALFLFDGIFLWSSLMWNQYALWGG